MFLFLALTSLASAVFSLCRSTLAAGLLYGLCYAGIAVSCLTILQVPYSFLLQPSVKPSIAHIDLLGFTEGVYRIKYRKQI